MRFNLKDVEEMHDFRNLSFLKSGKALDFEVKLTEKVWRMEEGMLLYFPIILNAQVEIFYLTCSILM